MPLGFVRQIVVISKDLVILEFVKALQHARWTGYFAIAKVAMEPPGQLGGKFRQPPIPELRNQQRFAAGTFGVTVRAECPTWTRCQLGEPCVPLSPLVG